MRLLRAGLIYARQAPRPASQRPEPLLRSIRLGQGEVRRIIRRLRSEANQGNGGPGCSVVWLK